MAHATLGRFFPFFFFLRNRLATNNVYIGVEVGLMHLARGITFRVEVVNDCQWGVLNFFHLGMPAGII